MKRINYITNLDVNKYSGGWSAMNHHVYEQLESSGNYSINLIQNVDPPVSLYRKLISKTKRFLGLKGEFYFYSISRLNKIKREVEMKLDNSADLDFYHGVTPWIMIEKVRPYALYLDASFSTYIEVYHEQGIFSVKHLRDIIHKEGIFLKKAAQVFFSSSWSLEQTKKIYDLTGENFSVAGLGGSIPIPDNCNTNYKKSFLFVGLDFAGKGGMLVAEAFNSISKKHKDFNLYFVGGKPPETVLKNPLVKYLGYFNKSDHHQFMALQKIFEEAYALVLPTNKDITPLVIVEAGYFGCPSIAVHNFGIPEMIKDGETGMLVASPPDSDSLAKAMEKICSDTFLYEKLRLQTHTHFCSNYTWERTGRKINRILQSYLTKDE